MHAYGKLSLMKKSKIKKSVSPLRILGVILLALPFISTFYGDIASKMANAEAGSNIALNKLVALATVFGSFAIGAFLMIYRSGKDAPLPIPIKWLAYAIPASILYIIANFINNFSN